MNLKTESEKSGTEHLRTETLSNRPIYTQLESHQPRLMRLDFTSSSSAAILLVFSPFFVRAVTGMQERGKREMATG